MRRISCVLIFIFLCSIIFGAQTSNQLLFRNIEWGTDATTVASILKDQGFPDPNISDSILWHDWGSDSLRFNGKDIGISLNYFFDDDFTIAGHEVRIITLIFLYGHGSDFITYDHGKTTFLQAMITFDTLDAKIVYDDLLLKLKTLYGNPVKNYAEKTYYQFYYAEWNGGNNTGINLQCGLREDEGTLVYQDVTLYYGKTNDKDLFSKFATTKEREVLKKQKSNYDGL
ncbi:MAG: hypothetical protein WDA14_12270 [Sphaerochaetaceae bacterium]